MNGLKYLFSLFIKKVHFDLAKNIYGKYMLKNDIHACEISIFHICMGSLPSNHWLLGSEWPKKSFVIALEKIF
jgi:hypothetical protein